MEDLLTPLKTTVISVSTHQQEPSLLQNAAKKTSTAQPPKGYESKKYVTYSNPDEVLEALRSKPQVEELRSALRFLRKQPAEGSFDITDLGPKAAQIINVLVVSIIPDFWDSLVPSEVGNQVQILPVEIKLLLECLTSVTGLGAIVAKLRSLCILYKDGKANIQRLDVTAQLAALHHALSLIVSTPTFLKTLYENAWIKTKDPVKQAGLWRETLAVVSSGKLVSAAIEAEDIIKAEAKEIRQKSSSPLQSGERYSQLLATFTAELALKSNAETEEDLPWRPLAQLLGKAGSIGFRGLSPIPIHHIRQRSNSSQTSCSNNSTLGSYWKIIVQHGHNFMLFSVNWSCMSSGMHWYQCLGRCQSGCQIRFRIGLRIVPGMRGNQTK